jgi:hypothetical protein
VSFYDITKHNSLELNCFNCYFLEIQLKNIVFTFFLLNIKNICFVILKNIEILWTNSEFYERKTNITHTEKLKYFFIDAAFYWAIKPSRGLSIYRISPCIRHLHKRQSHFHATFNEKHKTLSKSLPIQ